MIWVNDAMGWMPWLRSGDGPRPFQNAQSMTLGITKKLPSGGFKAWGFKGVLGPTPGGVSLYDDASECVFDLFSRIFLPAWLHYNNNHYHPKWAFWYGAYYISADLLPP